MSRGAGPAPGIRHPGPGSGVGRRWWAVPDDQFALLTRDMLAWPPPTG